MELFFKIKNGNLVKEFFFPVDYKLSQSENKINWKEKKLADFLNTFALKYIKLLLKLPVWHVAPVKPFIQLQ